MAVTVVRAYLSGSIEPSKADRYEEANHARVTETGHLIVQAGPDFIATYAPNQWLHAFADDSLERMRANQDGSGIIAASKT